MASDYLIRGMGWLIPFDLGASEGRNGARDRPGRPGSRCSILVTRCPNIADAFQAGEL